MYISQLVKNFKLLLLLIVFTISNATSEEIKTEKIHFAVINIQKITESCSVFQDIRNQMNDQFKKLSLKFDKQAKSIIDNENNLEKQKSVLDQKSYSEKMSEITKSKQKIQTELDSDKQKLQKIYFDAMNDINKRMIITIEKIATDNEYYAVFESSTLIYNSLNNITDDVIKKINEEIPNYKVDFEQKDKALPATQKQNTDNKK